jgi:probable HAF family extracellular repeat protein
LGGTDSNAQAINGYGQVVGFSYTDSLPVPFFGVPTVHPFLWQNGTMEDLGSLGGTFAVPGSLLAPGGVTLNNRGQVVGTSTLTGDQAWHPFLWEHGSMKDLGTLGGNNGEARFISESGYVVGRADVSLRNNTYHAFRWKQGSMVDLGVFPPCRTSVAFSVNSCGQVVGETEICPGGADGDAFLSQDGKTMVDLNSLVVPGSDLIVKSAAFINDRGEIAGAGALPDGEQRAVLLIPCDDSHPDVEGCDYGEVESLGAQSPTLVPGATATAAPETSTDPTIPDSLPSRFMQRGRMTGQNLWPVE